LGEFEINFLLQTTVTVIVLVSLAFRMRNNYLVHVATMTTAVVLGWVIFAIASQLLSDPSYMQTLTNPTLNLVTLVSHAFLGLASFISGTALAAILILDRAIPGRTNLLAKIVPTLWVLALIVGASFYVILHVL
jgi:uncharacterized membrane protein YkvI